METLNLAIDLLIGEKSYKVSRLSVVEVLQTLKDLAIEDYISNANKIAKTLEKEEKQEFLLNVWQKIPNEDELISGAEKTLLSLRGITTIIQLSLKKNNINLDVKNYVNNTNMAYFTEKALDILGFNISNTSEKKTETIKN
jgi:hypothetical protein